MQIRVFFSSSRKDSSTGKTNPARNTSKCSTSKRTNDGSCHNTFVINIGNGWNSCYHSGRKVNRLSVFKNVVRCLDHRKINKKQLLNKLIHEDELLAPSTIRRHFVPRMNHSQLAKVIQSISRCKLADFVFNFIETICCCNERRESETSVHYWL